jgi:hypothetical protein
MNGSGEPSTVNFLRNTLGVLRTCDTIRNANCPSGSALDSTFCLPLSPVAGAPFTTAGPLNARGNGCPDLQSFDLLAVNASPSPATGQLYYVKNGTARGYASIIRHNVLNQEFRTVLDGVPVGMLRTPSGDPHLPASCMNTNASLDRTSDILAWFGSPSVCTYPPSNAVPFEPPATPSPTPSHLGLIRPNPMTTSASVAFRSATAGGRVRLDIIDVTGRHVRTLLDEPRPEGAQDVTWDGRDDKGHRVAAGLYFVRMSAERYVGTTKILVMR